MFGVACGLIVTGLRGAGAFVDLVLCWLSVVRFGFVLVCCLICFVV